LGRIFRYVALGDSTAVGTGAEHGGGYPERLFQRMRAQGWPVGILNLAQNGSVARDVLQWQVPKAVSVSPHLITLGVGSNDLWRMVSEADFASSIDAIADALSATQAQVLVCNLVDLGHAPVAKMAIDWLKVPVAAISERVTGFNRHLATLASRPRFTVTDLHSLGERELRERRDFFSDDGFHPSGAGYQRWSELLWPGVEAAFRSASLAAQ
jgi:lysophospholipase L1-like esterase